MVSMMVTNFCIIIVVFTGSLCSFTCGQQNSMQDFAMVANYAFNKKLIFYCGYQNKQRLCFPFD